MLLSGQITVATAGTAVQGPSANGFAWVYKAHPSNAGLIYIGNDGVNDVDSTNGYALAAGDTVVLEADPSALWFDTDTNGDICCWVQYR